MPSTTRTNQATENGEIPWLKLPVASPQTSSAEEWESQHHDVVAPGDVEVKAFWTEKVAPDVSWADAAGERFSVALLSCLEDGNLGVLSTQREVSDLHLSPEPELMP